MGNGGRGDGVQWARCEKNSFGGIFDETTSVYVCIFLISCCERELFYSLVSLITVCVLEKDPR